MSVFVDTSAFYALLVRDEEGHERVVEAFQRLVREGVGLVTSNYILVETNAILQHRFGLDAVRDLQRSLVPLVTVRWIEPDLHRQALERLLKRDQRKLSFVDCTSFIMMDRDGIRSALALDSDFSENGYDILPAL